MLDEYHLQIDGPHFRTISSKYGLHIVPEFVRDASGHLVPAKNPLDAPITIPTANRAVSAHFAAICAAVTKATGLDVGCSAPGGGEDWYTKLFAAPGGVLEWGTNQISARDALADLLDNSSTTFSWRFLCQPNSAFGGRRCVLNLRPIYVAAPGGDGDMTVVRLEYDRRGPPAPTVIEPVP